MEEGDGFSRDALVHCACTRRALSAVSSDARYDRDAFHDRRVTARTGTTRLALPSHRPLRERGPNIRAIRLYTTQCQRRPLMNPKRRGPSRTPSTASSVVPRALCLAPRTPLLVETVECGADALTLQLPGARMKEARAVTRVLSILSQYQPQRTRMISKVRRVVLRRGVGS